MNRRLLLSLLVASFFLFPNDLFAQNITLRGIITDTASVGIPNAYLTVTSARDSSLISFKLSDVTGRYEISLKNPQKIRFIVNAVGFENHTQIVDIQKDTTLNFRLFPAVKLLDEVKVVAERPATFKEDTATFNANFYRTPADKNLNDLLKKLPGVEVNNGKIFVQGQEIKNLMVEGEELYENNPKLLSNALSAEMIDKIQIVDNFQDPNNPNGLNTNKKALNIKIREDKKNIPTGTLTGGGGVPENYLLNTDLFLFKPKTKWNVLANTNNVGKSIFTFEDFLQFSGKLEDAMTGGGGSIQLSADDIPQGIFQENMVSPRVSGSMLAVSLAHQFSPIFKLKNYTILNRSSAQDIFLLNRIYSNLPTNPYLENQNINRTSSWIESKSSLRYTPNKNDNLLYSFKVNYANNQRNSMLDNQFLQAVNSSQEIKDNTQLNFSNQLLWSHNFSSKNIFSVEAKYAYLSGKQVFNIMSSQDAFADLLNKNVSNTINNLSFEQTNNQPNQQFSFNISDKITLNKSWTINTRLGWNVSAQKTLFELKNNESQNLWNTDLLNQTADYSLQKYFAESIFKWSFRKMDITFGASVNNYILDFVGKRNQANINTIQVEPSVMGKLKFSQNQVLSLGYNFANNLPEMQPLNEVYSIESFRKISQGNRNLSISQRHNFSFQYYLFDLFNHVNAVIIGRYSLHKNPVRNNSFTDAKRDFSQFVNIGEDANSQVNINLGKDFYGLPVSVKVGLEWSNFNSQNVFNNVQNAFKNETFSYLFLLRSRFKGIFNIEASYKNTLRSLKTALSEKSLNNNLHKISTILTLKSSEKFLLNHETNWVQLQKENTTSTALTLMNISAEYHLNKRILLRAEGYNLLNNKQASDATVSPFYSQAQTQNILGSYGLLSLEYRF